MTQFIDKSGETKISRPTVFNKFIPCDGEISRAVSNPSNFSVVEYLGNDTEYGDVFKAYDNKNSFSLFIGVKGTEFDD